MDGIRFDADAASLHIGGVTITDPDVIREASRWAGGERGEPATPDDLAMADLSAFVAESVTVGARVLAIAAQTSDTLAVQHAVRTASDHVSDAVTRASAAADESSRRAAETLSATARDVGENLTAQITGLLGGENPELLDRLRPVLAKVGTDLEGQVAAAIATTAEAQRLETERRHAELAEMIRGVEQAIAIRAAEEAAAAQVRGSTTIKGFDYEAQVNSAFSVIAAGLGDEYTETGETAGRLPRNKKGDGVLSIDGGMARIVIECHDGTTKDWGPYLAEAERNRSAVASIGCIKHARDNGGHAIRVIGPRRVVVAYDPAVDDIELLRTVTLLMRSVALTSSGRFGTEEIATANDRIKEALAAIEELDDAKRSAAAINGHTAKIEQVITKAMTTIQRNLTQAMTALTGAASTSAPASAPTLVDTGAAAS